MISMRSVVKNGKSHKAHFPASVITCESPSTLMNSTPSTKYNNIIAKGVKLVKWIYVRVKKYIVKSVIICIANDRMKRLGFQSFKAVMTKPKWYESIVFEVEYMIPLNYFRGSLIEVVHSHRIRRGLPKNRPVLERSL